MSQPIYPNQNITIFVQPGVFRVDCIPTKFSLFLDNENILVGMQELRKSLEKSTCPYPKINEDFKCYGLENFDFYLVVAGDEFYDENIRKEELEKQKKAWSGFLYVK